MPDLTPFEQHLRDRLEREASPATALFDPGRIARAAIGRRRLSDLVVNRIGLGDLPLAPTRRLLAIAVVVLLLAAAIVALAVGGWIRPTTPTEPRLALLTEAGVALANADGSDRRIAYPASGQERLSAIEWAPGGEHIAVRGLTVDGYELLILDRAGHVTSRTVLQGRAAEVAWSPDGRRLAILDGRYGPEAAPLVTDAQLAVIDLAGSVEWTAPLPERFIYIADLGSLAWSPGGTAIAVIGVSGVLAGGGGPSGAERTSTWLVDPVAHMVRRLTPAGGSLEYAPAWSANGRLFLAREGTLASEIWELDPATGNAERLATLTWQGCGLACLPGQVGRLVPARDGSRVVFRDPSGGVSVLDVGTGAVRSLLPAADLGYGPFVWSDDGSSVLVSVNRPDEGSSDVVAVDVASGARLVLATGVQAFDLSQAAAPTR